LWRAKNRWNETIVQLWVPEEEESDEFMTADKFLSIYDRVGGMIALDPEAEIRFRVRGRELFAIKLSSRHANGRCRYHPRGIAPPASDL
jgi:hypothetical protein